MTCLIVIAGGKNVFSAFQFFHKHNWNSSSEMLIAAVLKPVIWKGQNYGNLVHRYELHKKTIVAGQKQPLRGVSRKQLILNCKNVKTDNLQLENRLKKYPWGILMKVQSFRVEAHIG